MFKSKRVKELEDDILEYQREIVKLNRELQLMDVKIGHMQQLIDNIPPDCKPGPWCKACHMVKVFYVRDSVTKILEPIYICGKSEVCPIFVDKYKEETNERTV